MRQLASALIGFFRQERDTAPPGQREQTATRAMFFAAGFANRIPCGALLLVSDQPMIPEGVKTEASDAKVSADYEAAIAQTAAYAR